MLNGKYGKVLTVILIIAIIVIVGLLIFMGMDWYKTYTTGSESSDMLGQFDGYINNIQQEENNTENEENVTELNAINNEQNITPIIPEIDENVVNGNTETNNNENSSTNQPINYNGFNMIGKIRIPKTGLECVILEEASPKAIEIAIGKMYGPGINEVGNTVLIGHNFKNGTFFSDNKKLSVGDKLYLTDTKGKEVEYVITKKYTTAVEDFDYAVRDTKGKREVSLSTCTDDTKSRLIIWAEET